MGIWDAITFERTAQGRSTSPVSSTTAADVSSQEVSIPRMSIWFGGAKSLAGPKGPALHRVGRVLWTRHRVERRAQRFRVGRAENPALGDDAADEMVRRDIERRIPDQRARGRKLGSRHMRHFPGITLLDRDARAIGRVQIDRGQRRRDVKWNVVLARQ